ncbi:MAG TPA: hypothetical protein VHX62_16260 [Solirubrobacteraceae bacterium]|nr:hypothetical protein [Solirubrobacteraceae bacterium]
MAERGLAVLRALLAVAATFVAATALIIPACAQAADPVGSENLAQAAASLAATGSDGAATIVAQAQALVPQVASGPANGSGVGAPGQSGEATSGGAPALPVSAASDVASPPASRPAAMPPPPPHVNVAQAPTAPTAPTVAPPSAPAPVQITVGDAGSRGGDSPLPVHVSMPVPPTASAPSSPASIAASLPAAVESVLDDALAASPPSADALFPNVTPEVANLPAGDGSRCAAAGLQADAVSALISCAGQNPAAGGPGVSLQVLLLQWLGGPGTPRAAGVRHVASTPQASPEAASRVPRPFRHPLDFSGAPARLIGRSAAPGPPPIRRLDAGRERRRRLRQAAPEASSATAPDQPGLAPGVTGGSAATASAGIGSGATAGLALAFVSLCAFRLLSGRVSLELSAWRSALLALRLERPG